MMYESDSHLVTVNYIRPDGRPQAAKTTCPARVLMSRTGDDLTITTGDDPAPIAADPVQLS
jgi:hypothetical protein